MKRYLLFVTLAVILPRVIGVSFDMSDSSEMDIQLDKSGNPEAEDLWPEDVLDTQETPDEFELRGKVQTDLKNFAIKLNTYISETHFEAGRFEPMIPQYTWELMVLNKTVTGMKRYKLYPELLLRMFGRQLRIMTNATQKLKKFQSTELLGDRLVYEMVEFKVIALLLDTTFFVLLRDTMEFEARILRHNCRFKKTVDQYRKLLSSTKIHNEPFFWLSVARTKKSIDTLKRFIGGRSAWGNCPIQIGQNILFVVPDIS